MGFYGNITNTAKTNFVFDKIYSNRTTMEENCRDDGVFIGRYVLIDYNEGLVDVLGYTELYKHETYNWFYTESSLNWSYRAKYKNLPYYIRDNENNYIVNPEKDTPENAGYIFQDEIIYIIDNNKYIFYKCIGEEDNINHFAKFEKLEDNSQLIDSYYQNYIIDRNTYGEQIGRGWDSTAWQKVYSGDKEKYVMVAELNSVVPSFGITVDSPTMKPVAPHFDADSTNTYYKLHLQPSWGFRIKQAENAEQSDTKINFSEYYWDNTSKSASITTHNYDGAIYFNQDGFDVNKHSEKEYDSKVDDYITVLPTGSSGYPYNDHGNSNSVNREDIQELEISLPGIGHAVSTMWDLVYGTGEGQEPIRNRNLEIGWDNVAGLRLVKAKSDGNGFEYNTEGVNTLAGCINSVHDLMGMIIVNDTKDITPEDALINRIYYKSDGKYYIKNLVDELISVEDSDYTGIVPNMKNFGDNLYYFNNNNYYQEDKYYHGNTYYSLEEGFDKQINKIELYEKPWEYGKYSYKDVNGNYVLVLADDENLKHPVETIKYYSIADIDTATAKINHKLGESGLCFYPSYNGEINQTYIDILFPNTSEIIENKVLKSGLFYEFETDEEENGVKKIGYKPVDFSTHQYSSEIRYYYWIHYKIEDSTTIDGNIVETYDFNDATKIMVNLVGFKPNTYYYQEQKTGNWINLTSISNINSENICYEFTAENAMEPIEIPYPFYEPNLYYYKDNKDFILAKEDNRVKETTEYYTIHNIQAIDKETIFYEPNKYYYKNENGEYILDTSDTMRDGVEYYYNIIDKYVIEDKNNIFSKGQKWNDFVKIPEDNSISLGYRKDSYEWKELEGFARTLNTIHGLILSINNLIKFDDTTTRNNKTVQGCINQMNDIINTIDKLKPNHFIAVDEYGRMTSMQPETDAWIDVKINPNNSNKVAITHEFKAVEDTSIESDINDQGNTIALYTPKVDEKGHIVGKTTNTVTLPFGYKTFQDSEETPGKTIAEHTQDILTLSGDSWIKPTITQGKIDYSHIGPVVSNEDKKLDLTPTFGQMFEIEDWYFDDKGHKSNRTTHTITIPQGSLTAAATNGSDVLIQLEFEPSTGEIKTVRENLANLKLNSYTKSEDNSDVINTDTLGQALSKLQTQIIEEESARINAINQSNIDLTDAINGLDVATINTESYEIFNTLSETDGKISATKKKVGELTLSGYVLGDGTNIGEVADNDSINNAFSKLQNQLNILNGNNTTPGSVAYQIAQIVAGADANFDTLKEIADWIISDTGGVATINSNIAGNTKAIKDLELLVGDTVVATQIANAINNALLIDGVSKYALAADLIKLSETVNNINDRVEDLELAVSAEKIKQWDAAEVNVQSDWTETDETADSYIKNKPTLDFVPIETYNALLERIAALEARIEALENPVVEEPTPDPENPEEPVE